MVFVGGRSVAYATNNTLQIGGENVDGSNKDETVNGWVSGETGTLNWSMTTENLYSEDGQGNNFNDLFTAMKNREIVDVIFAPSFESGDSVPTGGWTASNSGNRFVGEAYISDLQLTAQHGQYATFTATFTGVGALTFNGVTPWQPTIPTTDGLHILEPNPAICKVGGTWQIDARFVNNGQELEPGRNVIYECGSVTLKRNGTADTQHINLENMSVFFAMAGTYTVTAQLINYVGTFTDTRQVVITNTQTDASDDVGGTSDNTGTVTP